MSKFRTHFELGIKDIQIIEDSLTHTVGDLTQRVLDADNETFRLADSDEVDANMQMLTAVRDLLGRIHDQKLWYMSKENVPRG